MAWSTPKTWASGDVLTAADLNTYVRDNMNETAAATVTTAGDLVYADGANSVGSRLAIGSSGSMMYSTGTAPAWLNIPFGVVTPASSTGPSSASTWTDISSGAGDGDGIGSLDNPGRNVVAVVQGFGYMQSNDSTNDHYARARASLSFDGGSTWQNGQATQASLNDTTQAGGIIYVPFAVMFKWEASPTDTIKYKMQMWADAGSQIVHFMSPWAMAWYFPT